MTPLVSKGGLHRRPAGQFAIMPVSFVATPGRTLADLNGIGLWNHNLAGNQWNTPFDPSYFSIDGNGCLVMRGNPGTLPSFGEYSILPESLYTSQVIPERVLRSECLLEYQLLGGQQLGFIAFAICTNDPSNPPIRRWYDIAIEVNTPAIQEMKETGISGHGLITVFGSEYDTVSNKIHIAVTRIDDDNKRLTFEWWDRTLGAIATATFVDTAPGRGNIAHVWWIGDLAGVNNRMVVKTFIASGNPIPYGNPPV